jgi:hypothetical protein
MLIVVCVNPNVARWASRPIALDPGRNTFTPYVLGPGQVPVVSDSEQAQGMVQLAVLSAVTHAKTQQGQRVARAAMELLLPWSGEAGPRYYDLVMSALPPKARNELEAIMRQQGQKAYRSPLLREVQAKGKADGKAEGKRDALMRVLEVRGLQPTQVQVQRVQACVDIATLDTWFTRAITASSASEVFGDA